MTAREFQEWVEYYKQEPFGDDWLQASTIAAVTEGVWSGKRTRLDRYVPGAHQKARMDPRQLETQMMHIAALHNAQVERQERQQAAPTSAVRSASQRRRR